ncbi:MAG: hypothetical protein AAF193_03115, partial [Bacteroidota bacterium]
MKFFLLFLLGLMATTTFAQTLSIDESFPFFDVSYNVFPTFNHYPNEPFNGDPTQLFLEGFDASTLQAPLDILAVEETTITYDENEWVLQFDQAGDIFTREFMLMDSSIYETSIAVDFVNLPTDLDIFNYYDPGRLTFDGALEEGEVSTTNFELLDADFNLVQHFELSHSWYSGVNVTSFGNVNLDVPSTLFTDLILVKEVNIIGEFEDSPPPSAIFTRWFFFSPDNLFQPLFAAFNSDEYGFIWHEFTITAPTVSVVELEDEDKIHAYPVPFCSELTLEFQDLSSYQLLNSMGQTIIEGDGTSHIHNVNWGHLKAGIYFLKDE